IVLVTHTLRFNQAHWVTLEALEEHWKEARIDATLNNDTKPTRIEIATRNVAAFSVRFVPADAVGRAAKIVVDGQDLGERPTVFSNPPPGKPASWWTYSASKEGGKWTEKSSNTKWSLRKLHGLQGPIDDAFMDSF